VRRTTALAVTRPRNQLAPVVPRNRAARVRAAARQCAPSTLPSASSVSAGGRHKRRNTLFVGMWDSLRLNGLFL